MAHLIALLIAGSILVYSSTDILIGRWFQDRNAKSNHSSSNSAESYDRDVG